MARKRVMQGGSFSLIKLLRMYGNGNGSTVRTPFCVADNAIYDINHCLYCPHYLGQEVSTCGKKYFKRLI